MIVYIKIKNKKIKLLEYTTFKDRFKTFKFYLKDIDFGIKLSKKKFANTYFFCKRVDVVFTDYKDNVMYIYPYQRSEKLIVKLKAKNVYYLPSGSTKDLKIGDRINIIKK